MKTNITLSSQSRQLFGIRIRQETKTGFLNVSDLQEAYNLARIKNAWSEKRVDHILPQIENRERVYYILQETGFINVDFRTFMQMIENQGFYKLLKIIGAYKTTGRGSNKTTFCNPYVWGLIAMELNPQIYAKIVIWFSDHLILNRIEAGDLYKSLSKSVSKFPDADYRALAKSLNHVVFGRHESGIRNFASEDQLVELNRLESNLSFAVDAGLIKSFAELMNHINTLRNKKLQVLAA